MEAKSLSLALLAFCLLSLTGGSNSATAGPKQQAALDDCRAVFNDQIRTCRPGQAGGACVAMYTEKLNGCLADANTITELSGGGASVPPKKMTPAKLGTTSKASP